MSVNSSGGSSDARAGSHTSGDVRAFVRRHFAELPDRERLVLRLYYGIDCPQAHTFAEIGRMLDVPESRIAEILAGALASMPALPAVLPPCTPSTALKREPRTP